ncbi:MAG TPA: septum formation initiator [Prevotellaceae bacterium]|nr:septum formation initiator [Prevotellaceae bacterium]
MSKVHSVWNHLCKYKYVAVMLFAALLIGVLDENSLLRRSRRRAHITELRREIADYERRFNMATAMLARLDNDPDMLERVAREKYYMKRDGEDIFVIRATDGEDYGNAQTPDKNTTTR